MCGCAARSTQLTSKNIGESSRWLHCSRSAAVQTFSTSPSARSAIASSKWPCAQEHASSAPVAAFDRSVGVRAFMHNPFRDSGRESEDAPSCSSPNQPRHGCRQTPAPSRSIGLAAPSIKSWTDASKADSPTDLLAPCDLAILVVGIVQQLAARLSTPYRGNALSLLGSIAVVCDGPFQPCSKKHLA